MKDGKEANTATERDDFIRGISSSALLWLRVRALVLASAAVDRVGQPPHRAAAPRQLLAVLLNGAEVRLSSVREQEAGTGVLLRRSNRRWDSDRFLPVVRA